MYQNRPSPGAHIRYRVWPLTFLLVAFAGLTACLKSRNFTPSPDDVLFRRGTYELEHERFDVAALEFETLVNTYPGSEYAAMAKRVLKNDPRLDCRALAQNTFTPPISCEAEDAPF